MLKLLKICFILILVYPKSNFAKQATVSLSVEITNIKKIQGTIIIELFQLSKENQQEWLPEHLVHHQVISVTTKQQNISFELLSPGNYALRLYQDLNNNKQLDKSVTKIPLEPVGFTQNPSLFKGEPSIEKASFYLQENKIIEVKLKHRKPKQKRRV